MKSVIILGDGMADYPIPAIGMKTPLQVAKKPNIDYIASLGEVGLAKTVPDGMKPGSDNANLCCMGYDPLTCYTGRSPLEAVSIGVALSETDVTFRCNLVSLSEEEPYEDKTMVDYSSDEITTAEAKELIAALKEEFDSDALGFFAGVSYRHLLLHRAYTGKKINLTPPHDITTKKITDYLPSGDDAQIFITMMKRSFEILDTHPINLIRAEKGLKKANSIWLWGMGTKPALQNFNEKFGLKGAVISAVDLIKGIGILAGMESIDVPGATGTVKTNFDGKAQAAIDSFERGFDFVYVHMEAPDECGHRGELENKIKSIELIDEKVVKPIFEYLKGTNEPFSVLIMPDHPTPLSLRTHVADSVPYAMYKSYDEKKCGLSYDEETAAKSGKYVDMAYKLLPELIK